MKEIIYIDHILINSLLAQSKGGLVGKLITSLQTNLTESESIEEINDKGIDGGVPGFVNVGISNANKKTAQTEFSKANGELQEVVLNDYALNLLIDELNIKKDNFKEGDIVLVENFIKVFDFKRVESVTHEDIVTIFDPDKEKNDQITKRINQLENERTKSKGQRRRSLNNEILKLKESLKSVDEEALNNFKYVYKFGKLGNTLFPESCLVRVGNTLSICPKENLRVNDATLTLYNEVNRNVKCLAIIIYQREKEYIKKGPDGKIVQLDTETIAASSPTIMMNILLDNFNLSSKGDYIVKPVSIYFE